MSAQVPIGAMSTADADWADHALADMLARCLADLAPPESLSIVDWVERYRWLSAEENPNYEGQFNLDNTPHLRGILAVLGDASTRRCVAQKPAQWAWSAGVVCTVLGYHVHWRPRVQVVMFPRAQSAKDFDAEKFSPMVAATPALAERIRLKSRSDGNSATRKKYPGGLIKFVASNSPSDVKSTSATIRIVEEPDDTNKDVRGQGNSIALLRERGKTIRDAVELIGGSPTAKGASEIEREIRTTDQRRFMAACHHCGERHEVEWEHVTIPGFTLTAEQLAEPDADVRWPLRDVYGRARWEDAYYTCPHCGGLWTDDERHDNIRRSARIAPNYGWEPTAQSPDPGFYGNELQTVFDGSRVPVLAEKYLRARYAQDNGDPTLMVIFENATRGRCWEYIGELPPEDELRDRAEDYAEWTVPAGGLVPVMFVDVQHDRLAVCVWVLGRGEEMWLSWWGELHGLTILPGTGAWLELEQLMTRTVHHASGAALAVEAVGIDSGDGQTSDAVYAFCRRHHRRVRPVLATKGASDRTGRVEIYNLHARQIDAKKGKPTKAAKYGVQSHQIGTAKAKDLILGWASEGGRIRLHGNGPGRMHWHKAVRSDFYEQMLSELKLPHPTNARLRVWTERTDRRNEALDCTVGCLWLSRYLQLHLRKPWQWQMLESRMLQASLLEDDRKDDEEDDEVDGGSINVGAIEPPAAPQPAASTQPAAAQIPAPPLPRPKPPRPRAGRLFGGVSW